MEQAASMAKPNKKISAADVRADIRAGIPDSALMKKYRLSPMGLQDLLKKMEQRGLVAMISARDFLRDIRIGMSDVDLMAKYELSAKSLGTVFEQMENAGISICREKTLAAGSKNKVRINEVVKDIRSSLTKQELMEKHRLTSRGLSWVLTKLISMGAISWEEIYGKVCSSYQELALDMLRRSERHTPHFYVPIYASAEPKIVGRVRDVSQHGISVKGIQAEVDETQTLIIPGDSFGELGRLIFDARCAWSGKDSWGEYLSGFEITNVEAGSKREFQLLIELSSLKTLD
jgi:DNA-binding Lrp family transcriptional regulator